MMRKLLLIVALAAALPGSAACAAEAGAHYAVPFLGDMHYDRMEHHDLAWVKEKMGKDLRQIDNYVKVTAERTPALLAKVAAVAAASPAPAPFVIQGGDFTEGLCGRRELQAKQFADAFAAVDAAIKLPFYSVRGNHDVTGPGAREAGDDVFLPRLRRVLGDENAQYNYVVEHGPDVFLFWEAMRPDVDWLEAELAKHPDKRHVFVVTHYPVIPYNYRAHWGIFAKKAEQKPERDRLLDLLGRRNAIVLTAHLHELSLVERAAGGGVIRQVSVSSVINNPASLPSKVMEGLESYTPELAAERDADSPGLAWRRELIAAEKPFIRRYYRGELDGFAVLRIAPESVDMDLWNLEADQPVLTLNIVSDSAR